MQICTYKLNCSFWMRSILNQISNDNVCKCLWFVKIRFYMHTTKCVFKFVYLGLNLVDWISIEMYWLGHRRYREWMISWFRILKRWVQNASYLRGRASWSNRGFGFKVYSGYNLAFLFLTFQILSEWSTFARFHLLLFQVTGNCVKPLAGCWLRN